LLSERSIRALSAGDRNSTHHSCGMSRPWTKRCDRPVGASLDEVRDVSGSLV
jgi:hypothetical protein